MNHLAHLLDLESKEQARLAREQHRTGMRSKVNDIEGESMVERANRELLEQPIEPSDPDEQSDVPLTIRHKSHKKKAIPERNRMRMRKGMQQEARLMKRKKAIAAQLDNLKQLKQHASASPMTVQGKEIRMSLRGMAPAKRIGNRTLISTPLAIKLPEEQAGSLRLLVPELDPVRERFRSSGGTCID